MDNDIDNLSLIACVDRNWNIFSNIGSDKNTNDNPILSYYTKVFNSLTVCNTIIIDPYMIDNVFPNKKPLLERQNIVLSDNGVNNTSKEYIKKGYITLKTMYSIADLLDYIRKHPYKKFYVVGGTSVYKKLYSYCKSFYIMHINDSISISSIADKNISYVNQYLIDKNVRNKGTILDLDTKDRYQMEEYIING